MRVALLQVASPDDESVADRVRRVGDAVRHESGLGATDLLVLPELWNVGYFAFDEYGARAEPLAGPTVTAARAWATDLGLYVHLGSIVEVDEARRLHNTSVVIAPDGSVLSTYRKVHVFGYGSREQELLTPGASVSVDPIAGMPTGITTCYDLRFPELYRSLVDQGTESVAVCAAWPAGRLEHWRLFTTVRAVEQQAYLVACNAVGEQHGVLLGGRSRVVDPWGQVLVEAGTEEGFTFADLDPDLPERVRAEFPALADRRWPAVPTTQERYA
ncbi:carbon-nitrogen family hydrolase [Actinomadura sp. NEAU-AAG7]|uniref:carbon-nitrogen family hydrolase n=1 Tax=Actinomadura sp. NEAU-AAG7 TaxID=2839640 RepID=UPI001BE3DD53|nr:carbon-nitrogen family hydrolase [Actinomadura sp. NEAU-AAG7]MBT2207255.1 carbon-nitrogen family hydrolase [Actinomadura sp. NEAU-AAG7]